jgi:hypothetical protein
LAHRGIDEVDAGLTPRPPIERLGIPSPARCVLRAEVVTRPPGIGGDELAEEVPPRQLTDIGVAAAVRRERREFERRDAPEAQVGREV